MWFCGLLSPWMKSFLVIIQMETRQECFPKVVCFTVNCSWMLILSTFRTVCLTERVKWNMAQRAVLSSGICNSKRPRASLLSPTPWMNVTLVHSRVRYPAIRWYPFIYVSGERQCGVKMSCPRKRRDDRDHRGKAMPASRCLWALKSFFEIYL